MKPIKSSIFQSLFEKKICFAVCVSLNSARLKSLDEYSRDYFIISSMDDYAATYKLGFRVSEKSYMKLPQYELSSNEILEFKTLQDKFTKVIHNNDGRVYELKGNSLKVHIDNLKPKQSLKPKNDVSKSSCYPWLCGS